MSYFYTYVDPSELSPSFSPDLRIKEDGVKDGTETRGLVPENDPPNYYSGEYTAESDVDSSLPPTTSQKTKP